MTTYEEASAGETCARKRRSRSRGRRVGKDRRYKSNTTKKVEKLVQDLGKLMKGSRKRAPTTHSPAGDSETGESYTTDGGQFQIPYS